MIEDDMKKRFAELQVACFHSPNFCFVAELAIEIAHEDYMM
jgi:hypothetical protein